MIAIQPTTKRIFLVIANGWRMMLPEGSVWCSESLLLNKFVVGNGVVAA